MWNFGIGPKYLERNPATGAGLFHNPVYHLKRYVDLVSHEDLVSQGFVWGGWDELPSEGGQSDLNLSNIQIRMEFGESNLQLHDVHVFAGVSAQDHAVIELASFSSLGLQELEQLSWTISQGTVLQLLAASSTGGALDVILATGDPFNSSTRGVPATSGTSPFSLQLITNSTGGFTTLVSASLIGPSPDYNDNGVVDAADYVLWRKTLGTMGVPAYSGADGDGDGMIDQDDYDVWHAHFGQQIPAAGAASGATPAAGSASGEESSNLAVNSSNAIPATSLMVPEISSEPLELPASGVRMSAASDYKRAVAAALKVNTNREEALTAWLVSQRNQRDKWQFEFDFQSGDNLDSTRSNDAFACIDAGFESLLQFDFR